MKEAILTKEQRKQQRKQLDEALNKDKSQGAALRHLKRLEDTYDIFKLSPFQRAIVDNQDVYFHAVQLVYTPTQNKKVEQIKRLKDGKEPLTKTRYYIEYENNGLTFKASGSYDSKEDAENEASSLSVKNVSVVSKTTEISTTFTPKEMLSRLQRLEKLFYDTFESETNRKTITIAKVKRAIGEDVTKKDKDLTEKSKEVLAKAS